MCDSRLVSDLRRRSRRSRSRGLGRGLVAVEPARTHDVAELLRRAAGRFPQWFRGEVDHLASISTEMAGDRGIATGKHQ